MITSIPLAVIKKVLASSGIKLPRGHKIETVLPYGTLDRVTVPMARPASVRSLFATLGVDFHYPNPTNLSIGWSYTHRDGAQNGKVVARIWQNQDGNWYWRTDDGDTGVIAAWVSA